jgi:hypothetical protein
MRADHSTILALSMTGGLLSVCSLPVTSFETALLASTIALDSNTFHPVFPDLEDNTRTEEAQMKAETERMKGIDEPFPRLTSASVVHVVSILAEREEDHGNLEDPVNYPGEQPDWKPAQRQRRSKEKRTDELTDSQLTTLSTVISQRYASEHDSSRFSFPLPHL